MATEWLWRFRIFVLLLCLTGCKLASDETNETQTGLSLQKQALLKIGRDMVFVPDGAFPDGCPDDSGPRPLIAVHNYYISKYEVSQDEWEAVMDTNPGFPKCPDCPVNNISFADALIFIKRVNALTGKQYRLPTGGEWKYMKRGGRSSLAYSFSGSTTVKFDSTIHNSHYVDQMDSNMLGIYDLDSSDAWEFCNAVGQSGQITVMRSAYSIRQDYGRRWCCISYSCYVAINRRDNSLGLRLAKD